MHSINYSTCQHADLVKHLAIAQDEAFHDAPCESCRSLKRCLPMFHKVSVDRGWHILWSQEARIVWIEQGSKWRNCIHIGQQCLIVRDMASTREASQAFLQQPHAHHVLEKAGSAENSSLVGAVGSQCSLGHDWLRE